jgi:uracil-DNA glycosylase
MKFLPRIRAIVALGRFAWDGIHQSLRSQGHQPIKRTQFAHGAENAVGPFFLIASYHPSQQNTFTGRLTEGMLDNVFCKALAASEKKG